jgi:hypothetical protein
MILVNFSRFLDCHMAKPLRPEHRIVIHAVFIFLLSLICPSYGDTAQNNHRSDIVHIRLPAPSEGYKMPEVNFLHDLHTDALDKNSCQKCHQKKEDDFIFKFNRTEDLDYKKGKELYHSGCIRCHEDLSVKGKKSGPRTGQCRLCHTAVPSYSDVSKPFEMDKSLHYRHVIAETIHPIDGFNRESDGNCSACHHEYDKALKKTIYAKGKEGTCRYCHKQEKTDDARSFQTVAHEACLNCHIRLASADVKAGPSNCAHCHDPAQQTNIAKILDIPRINRNQPDTVLMSIWLKDALNTGKPDPLFVLPVAYNHLAHEKKVERCRTCHHESMESCSSCHTRTGDKKGKFVPLEHAMHSSASALSCIGCHRLETDAKDCAGCHAQINQKGIPDQTCADCHSVPRQSMEPLPFSKDATAGIAENQINKRVKPIRMTDDHIPEKVSISIMADQYEAAIMPHRQIVSALYKKTENSGLASFFHDEPTSLCKGCHHHNPSAESFPKCASCHEFRVSGSQNGKPGLLGAYHGQCINCHQQMGIDKPVATDCTACHKKKEVPATASNR